MSDGNLSADQIAVECDLHCAWKGGGACLRDDCPRRNSDKGLLNGRCNRTACTNRPATWYSTVEQAHYCQPCALKINDFIPAGVAKLYRVEQAA